MGFHEGDSSGGIPQLGFSFTDLTDQALNVLINSDIAQVAGLTIPTSLSLSGLGTPQMRICSAADCSAVVVNWTSTPQMVSDGQYMQLRTTSQSTPGGTSRVILSSGGAQTVWDVTTVGGTIGPSDCPSPGQVCADGTIYVGKTPDGDVDYFALQVNTGSFPFNGGGTGWLDTGLANCSSGSTASPCRTGEYNTGALAISDSESTAGMQIHRAAMACHCLGEEHTNAPNGVVPPECAGNPVNTNDLEGHGHDDWYLPAIAELDVMYKNLVSPSDPDNPSYADGANQGDGSTDAPNDGPQAAPFGIGEYFSSSESDPDKVFFINFSNGMYAEFNGSKSPSRRVRCVRK
jgi:hypothetical protein